MNNKIIELLADRNIINEKIINLVKEEIENLPYKVNDKCININTNEIFWIYDIRPTLLNNIIPNGHFTIYINPPKCDGMRSNRKKVLYYADCDIKKLEDQQ